MTREPRPDEAHLFNEVYVDETSQTGQRFFVVGGVVIPREYSAKFEQAIVDARGTRLPLLHPSGEPREINWRNCKNGDFDAYRKVVDAFFDFRKQMGTTALHSCKFHSSVVDTQCAVALTAPGRRGSLASAARSTFTASSSLAATTRRTCSTFTRTRGRATRSRRTLSSS